jgi:hypothetical protein
MTIVSFSADLLLSWASLKSGARAPTAMAGNASSGAAAAPAAPWQDVKHQTPASALVNNALSGKAFFDPNAKAFATPGATADEKKLFALYTGLNTLAAVVGRYDQASASEQARLQTALNSGLTQLDSFLATAKFQGLTVQRGASLTDAASTAAVGETKREYVTGIVSRGDPDIDNAAFAGALQFTVDAVDSGGTPHTIAIDLNDMGATPRTLNNVVDFLNSKLRGAGLTSAFSTVNLGAANGADQWALKLSVTTGESLSFSTPAAGAAIYVTGGDNQLVKLIDPASGVEAPASGGALNTAFAKALAENQAIGAVHASAAGPDGSLYILADIKSGVANQPIKGEGDVALFKYDTAGNLVYTRTLGAASTASGFSLAVSASGDIAIAGSVTGGLSDGADASSGADAFVTLFNADGVEQWTARGLNDLDDEARGVAFGADGSVYVAGRAKTLSGDWDSTLSAYAADGTLRASQSFGTVGDDGASALAVEDLGNGSQRVTLAGLESGKLVLRQFDDDGATLAAGATRDFATLAGGAVTGLALDGGSLYIAGSTRTGGLDVASVAQAYTGGQDGFVIKVAADLAAAPGERVTYVGGAGDETAAGLAVSNGQVWIGGDSTAAFSGQAARQAKDGYVARLDGNGGVAWLQRFASGGKDFAASAFAVDQAGASALDRLGLPQGDLGLQDETDLVSRTALRAGDQFSIAVNARSAQTITIAADDTLQTLADRIEKTLLSAGAATVALSTAGDKLKITASAGARITLTAGPSGRDALAGLGLQEGVVAAAPSSSASAAQKKPLPAYGLGVGALSLADKTSRKRAVDELGAAMQTVQKAFQVLTTPASATIAAAAGAAPAYLTKQLANYQAALARLQAG